MKRKILLFISIVLSVLINISCHVRNDEISDKHEIHFISSDKELENAFNWAKQQALSYRGDSLDPVGPWYEAALPGRYAFCMRDVSHQCIGAEILGLDKENENMMTKFAANISESKKWCSYWEIDKWNKPAPADYANDNDFWYNLNANFDVMYACWRLYNWTGNKMYIREPVFVNFYKKSINEYIKIWKLGPDSLLFRSENLNVDPSVTERKFKHGCGLASYVENVPELAMSTDLIAAIYQGHITYSKFLEVTGRAEESVKYSQIAEKYFQFLNETWWDSTANLYNTYCTSDGSFGKGEGETFLLWFDILKDKEKINRTIEHLTSKTWNVENSSYLPYLLYINGYWGKAYEYLLYCSNPATERREYPEVSYGVIDGIVQGLMGVNPDAANQIISTLHRANKQSTSRLKNLPVLGAFIDIIHEGNTKSSITNNSEKEYTWRAMFAGSYQNARCGNKLLPVNTEKNLQGDDVTYVDYLLSPGDHVEITVY